MSEQPSCLQVEMLAELKKQTAILERMERQQSLLIQAMTEDDGQDPDA